MVVLQRVISIFKIVGIIGLITTSIYTVKVLVKPTDIVFVYDGYISGQLRAAFAAVVSVDTIRCLGAKGLYRRFQKICGALKSVIIRYRGSRTAQVTLAVAKPILSIIFIQAKGFCTRYCLTDNNTLVSSDFFIDCICEDLPEIYIESYSTLEQFKNFLKTEKLTIPSQLFVDYKIIWRGKNAITLLSKGHKNFIIIADHKALETSKVALAELIYKTKQETERVLRLDIRLRDFIVCAHLTGGGYENS
jgi:hypothetical protein